MQATYRLGVDGEDLFVDLVYGAKVVHICDKDVYLDHVVDAASGCL